MPLAQERGNRHYLMQIPWPVVQNALRTVRRGSWQLPNVKDLQSLIGFAFIRTALSDESGKFQWSEGHPFIGMQSNLYWSSATYSVNTTNAWCVNLLNALCATNTLYGMAGSRREIDALFPFTRGCMGRLRKC